MTNMHDPVYSGRGGSGTKVKAESLLRCHLVFFRPRLELVHKPRSYLDFNVSADLMGDGAGEDAELY
jgi:hypothetical protein